jgi:hypothetical protein
MRKKELYLRLESRKRVQTKEVGSEVDDVGGLKVEEGGGG